MDKEELTCPTCGGKAYMMNARGYEQQIEWIMATFDFRRAHAVRVAFGGESWDEDGQIEKLKQAARSNLKRAARAARDQVTYAGTREPRSQIELCARCEYGTLSLMDVITQSSGYDLPYIEDSEQGGENGKSQKGVPLVRRPEVQDPKKVR